MPTDIAHPETDWSGTFTAEKIAEMRADEHTAHLLDIAEADAWQTFWMLTAGQVALAPVTIRPCAARCAPNDAMRSFPVAGGGHRGSMGSRGASFDPFKVGGVWLNACGCRRDCSCTALSEVRIPFSGGIDSIVIDGETLERSAYRVDNGNRLVRTDGGQWPVCQDMAAEGGAGTFLVRLWIGNRPTDVVRFAVGLLAAEMYAAATGGDCRLPSNVVSVVQQGTSYELDPADFGDGKTGIPNVDRLIGLYNPHMLKAAPMVSSPDAPAPARMATAR